MSNYADLFLPSIFVSLIESLNSEAAFLRREAVYLAAGSCAFDLLDALPFQCWLESSLFAEAKLSHPMSAARDTEKWCFCFGMFFESGKPEGCDAHLLPSH